MCPQGRALKRVLTLEKVAIREVVPEATFISSVCITGSIITRYFILKQAHRRFTGRYRAEPEEEQAMSYHRIPMMMQPYRRLCVKRTGIWECHILLAAHRRQVLTVQRSSAGYFLTAECMTCHEPRHREFMTSVLRCQRQMQRQGILSFLPGHTTQGVRLHTLAFIVEMVRWCIVVIQSNTHPSIHLTGRAIFTALED